MARLKSSFKPGSLFLRKHRKWPHSPYKSKWHQVFNQQLAMRSLKQASLSPPTQTTFNTSPSHLLSSLINSFTIYGCEPTPQAYHFLFKTLIKTSQLHQIPLILDHLEKVEKFETPQFILSNWIEFYGNFNDTQSAVDLFYRIPKFRCVPSVDLLNTLLSMLCKTSKGLKFVPEVLLKSQDMNIRMEESTFRILIGALCRIKKVGCAVEMFNCLIKDGFSVDSKVCSLLLSALCDQAELSSFEVMSFLGELRILGFCPGMVDYSKVIRFLVRGGMGMEALDVLNQMKLDGIKPDIVCYTMVLNGVIANGDYPKADKLFDELLVYGLVPDLCTYNVYIDGLCKQNNVEAGIQMVTSMEELGCKPNLITYNILLGALCKNGEVSRVKGLLKKMELKGIGPSMQTYKVMIHGLTSNNNVVEAYSLLEEVLDRGLCPSGLIFDEVVCGLCRTGSICKALELLEKMASKSVCPGVKVWDALLLECVSNVNFAKDAIIDLVDSKTNSSTLPKP